MKFYKSITFKLFVLLSLVLAGFVCLLIFTQIFIIGRSYMFSEHTLERKKFLEPLIGNFVDSNAQYMAIKKRISLQEMERFEIANRVSLVIFDDNIKSNYMTDVTRETLKPDYINYIGRKIKELYPHEEIAEEGFFRIYNKYNFPTKYVALVSPFYFSRGKQYIVTVIPEVFTSKSSKTLKDYIVYIFTALVILIFSVSGLSSYFVAKPVLEINKTASKIASLNFTEKCQIKSEDEIGSLAQTINNMSDNLESTLDKLYAANEKLQKDLDLQKELDILRKEFIAAITHEFKTPITLIRGFTESIKDNVAEGEEKESALNTIIDETENMDKLVRDLLDLSKLEAVGYNLNVSEFSINELFTKIIKKYEKLIEEKNLKFISKIEENNVIVQGDSFRIEQVISNFINNAIEYTQAGKKITMSLEEKSDYVLISVQNQGENIEENELNRIWEKFYRIEKSRNKKLGGTGLGLAISKSILDLHRSEYGTENTNDGVRFFFTLKIIDSSRN